MSTFTKLTKSQLVDQLEAAHAAYERVATERDSLKAQLAAAPAPKAAKPAYVPPAPTEAQLAYRAKLAAAKAAAIAGGRSVVVQ